MLRPFTPPGLAALALLTPGRSLAHAVQTDVSSLLPSGLINLRTSFSSGEPLANAPVRLESHDGNRSIALGETDADGRFTGELPALDSDAWDVVIDGGIGHRDYLGLDESWPSSEALMGWLRNGGLLGATLALTGISLRHGQRQRRP